ncbi:GAF and ANTAR domain-containing protein [Kutzneria sp. CA-103260]|uniref:GAF and ANTAR domain-containing protein n=1 Tax=Kutzneria sp. CA-103260 TaxID=2802641 RepID=UPI001BA9DEC5|nr:GAF and ANTAR domain-containing protein [Kutzneria sp. CA-103260]QUQ64148.1 GAF domain protein [Kutzneria sp. CA-103260]
MSMDGRRWQVLAAIMGTAGLINAVDTARRVCDYSARRVGAADAAISLMSSSTVVHVVATVGDHDGVLPDTQFALGEGPCLEAYRGCQVVAVADLEQVDPLRWPGFCAMALEAGIRSVLSIPLQAGGSAIGSLDLTWDSPAALPDDALADLLLAADVATKAILLLQSSPDGQDQLTRLLGEVGRETMVVHQATGFLSSQLDITPEDALARLRAHALANGGSLYQLAREIVAGTVRLEL